MRLITEMYSHQIKAVEKLKRIKIGAAYMEMGTGTEPYYMVYPVFL